MYLGISVVCVTIFAAALLKAQKERQERQVKEEEDRRERERQEAEELVRKMHEEACDEPSRVGGTLNLSEGHAESELHLPKDQDSAADRLSPVTVVSNIRC
jgi:regulator of protease activity HflC (stomatin/prohibitin superfamily)